MDLFTGATLLVGGISKVKELWESGKEVITDIKGEPSRAGTPEELIEEIKEMSPEQQQQWVDRVNGIVKLYEAQTERLKAQESTSEIIEAKVDSETASEIAYQRQTTRPWSVRKMVHFLLFPFYLVGIDVAQNIIKNWLFWWTDKVQPFESFTYVFGVKDGGLVDKIGNIIGPMPKTLAGDMYVSAIPFAAGIIITYMTLREIGKGRNKEGGDGIIGKAVEKVGLLGRLFGSTPK